MSRSKEFEKIKRKYGERFAKFCEANFPKIMEKEGSLTEVLDNLFSNNCCQFLFDDIMKNNRMKEFKEFILYQYEKDDEDFEKYEEVEPRTPYEILDEAGYNLYECLTEREIQDFRKYYKRNELICTIENGDRLSTHYCFFAVRKDVDQIKREDFSDPKKDDEYSTSVLGIQFNKFGKCTTKIISRYNHTVVNPDCTLNNDLNNIAPGLEQSFKNLLRERGVQLNFSPDRLDIPGYTLADDEKYYKYNKEINGIYYCPGNIIIKNGEIKNVGSTDSIILADYFYINKSTKEIKLLDSRIKDSFVDEFQEGIIKIEDTLCNDKDVKKIIKIYKKDVEEPIIIGLDKANQIVKYENVSVKEIGNDFLKYNSTLTKLNLPNAEKIGDNCLHFNNSLEDLELLNMKKIGHGFLTWNKKIKRLILPEVKEVGDNFVCHSYELIEVELSKLEKAGDFFLEYNSLKTLILDSLKQVGHNFFRNNTSLKQLYVANLEKTGDDFLHSARFLTKLFAPKLRETGNNFLYMNEDLTELELLNLERIGEDGLWRNKMLKKFKAPKLKYGGSNLLYNNRNILNRQIGVSQNMEIEDEER